MKKVSRLHSGYNNRSVLLPIADLLLGDRIKNRLSEKFIWYVGQLISYTPLQLEKIPQLGRKGIFEIKEVLKKYDLALAELALAEGENPLLLLNSDEGEGEEVVPLLKEYYCITDEDCGEELSINLALPATNIETRSDDELIEIVAPKCQDAFLAAVNMMVDHRNPNISSENIQLHVLGVNVAAQNAVCGKLRTVRVPVSLGESMSQMLSKEFLRSVADKLGGLTLYPALKPIIDVATPKAVFE